MIRIYLIFSLFVIISIATLGQTNPNVAKKSNKSRKIISVLLSCQELSMKDLKYLNWKDTVYTFPKNGYVYCDTIVYINNNTAYSIITLGDNEKICQHYYILLVNYKDGYLIDYCYLRMDCDADLSIDQYSDYDHEFVSKDSILLKEIIITQKKEKEPDNLKNVEKMETIVLALIVIKPEGIFRFSK